MGSLGRQLVVGVALVLVAGTASGCAFLGFQETSVMQEISGGTDPNASAVIGPEASGTGPIAGWTADPQAPDQAFLDAGQDICVFNMLGPDAAPEWVIVDQRGPDAAAFRWGMAEPSLGTTDQQGECFLTRHGVGEPIMARLLDTGEQADGSVSQRTLLGPEGVAEGDLTIMSDRVAASASGVRIWTDEGRTLRATVGDGRWLAWWPDHDCAVTIEFLDAAGEEILVMEPQPRLLAPC